MPVGHRGADGAGDECALNERAALVAGGAEAALLAGEGAEAALLAGEGEEEFVVAVGAMEVGEAGVEVSAAPEGGDGAGGRRPIGRRILRCGRGESARPPRRGAGGAVEAADHGR